jgi:hypothetical protein
MSDTERRDGTFRVTATAYPFTNLVALDVRWPGNRIGGKFPLNLLLEVEEHHLTVHTQPSLLQRIGQGLSGQIDANDQVLRLRVRLRHCYVRYRSDQIEIIPESKYRSAIVEGGFELHTSEKSSASATSQLGAGLDAKVTATHARADASLGAHAKAAFTRRGTRTIETTTRARPGIYEVEVVPNGWRVGDREYGDPNKLSHCLDGRYFHRPVGGFPQSCEAEFRKGSEHGVLTFTVSVRDGLHIERIGGGSAGEAEVADAVTVMRNRIAAIRLERCIGRLNDDGRPDNELPIAMVRCEVVKAIEDSPIATASDQLEATASVPAVPDAFPVPLRRSRRVRS